MNLLIFFMELSKAYFYKINTKLLLFRALKEKDNKYIWMHTTNYVNKNTKFDVRNVWKLRV